MRALSLNSLTGSSSSSRELLAVIFDLSELDIEIMTTLLRTNGLNIDELDERIPRDKSTVFRSLQKLVSLGLVIKESRNLKEGGYYHVYSLADVQVIKSRVKERVKDLQTSMSRILRDFEADFDVMIDPSRLRVLIADDETDIRTTCKKALEKRGHYVKVTSDGESCIRAYENAMKQINASSFKEGTGHPYDVVVLDYKMPGLSGLEVARRILSQSPNQRIVFASAYIKDTVAESVRELKHAVELLPKPFDAPTFIRVIEDEETRHQLERLVSRLRNQNSYEPTTTEVNHIVALIKKSTA